jgi:hypothetical protein
MLNRVNKFAGDSSNEQDHENIECCGTDAARATGDDSDVGLFTWGHVRHMVLHKLQFTHRLYPRGLELSMSIMRIWQCLGHLHLQHYPEQTCNLEL